MSEEVKTDAEQSTESAQTKENTSTDDALMASGENKEAAEETTEKPSEDTEKVEPKIGETKEEEPEGKEPEKEAKAEDADAEVKRVRKVEEKKKEEKSKAPEAYDLTVSENSPLTDAQIDKIVSNAREQGLSNEDAQKLLDSEDKAVSEHVQLEQQRLAQTSKQWIEDVKADEELGGEKYDQTVTLAKKAISKWASPKLIQTLNDTGFGNHPELVRVFARIGRAMSDDSLILGNTQPAAKPKSAEEIFYGNSKES